MRLAFILCALCLLPFSQAMADVQLYFNRDNLTGCGAVTTSSADPFTLTDGKAYDVYINTNGTKGVKAR